MYEYELRHTGSANKWSTNHDTNIGEQIEHNWPTENAHLWTAWRLKTGLPKPTEYRNCIHPNCKEYEERDFSEKPLTKLKDEDDYQKTAESIG